MTQENKAPSWALGMQTLIEELDVQIQEGKIEFNRAQSRVDSLRAVKERLKLMLADHEYQYEEED